MAIYKRNIIDVDLETGNIYRSFLKHSIGMKDNAADHFGIRVFRNREEVDLGGVSVQGIFMPPQGSPIAITSGNIINGNTAEVVLPQACYNYEGQFTLAIKLVGGGITGTIRIIDGIVDNTHADGTVAPTETVPTYQEILAVYNEMLEATEEVEQIISNTKKAVGDVTEQLYDPTSAKSHINKRWNAGGGLSDAPGYTAVEVDVKSGERYMANAYATFTFFYDAGTVSQPSSDRFIIGRYGTYSQYTAPRDGKFLFTIANGYELICRLYDDIFLPDKKTYSAGKRIKVSPEDKPFEGIKYAAIGDSITYYDEKEYINTTFVAGSYCKGYQSYIVERMGFTKINMGYSGQNSNYMKTQVLATDFSDVDVASIMTGMNDGGQSVPIATYKQNIIDMIVHISTDNPWCRIFLLSPTYGYFDHPQGAYPTGGVTRDYADAMKEVAYAYNIPFYDNMLYNGLSYQNYSQYMADKINVTTYAIHPNAEGYKIMGTQMANWMYELMVEQG